MPSAADAGVSSVNSDQNKTPSPSTHLPPKRSDRYPAGICRVTYPRKKADMTAPWTVGDQPLSSAIGIMAIEIAIRSIMQMYTARTVMKTSQREPEGDTAPALTFNIESHNQDKSARYCRASRIGQHAFCCAESTKA